MRKFGPAMQHYERKKKKKQDGKTEQFISLHPTREFRARELCIWVS